MTKRITTVYIEDKVLKRAKARGINVSKFVEKALKDDVHWEEDKKCKDCGAVWNPSKIKDCPQCSMVRRQEMQVDIDKKAKSRFKMIDKMFKEGKATKEEVEKARGDINGRTNSKGNDERDTGAKKGSKLLKEVFK